MADKELARRLKELRQANNLSKEELAKMLDLSTSTLNNMELGRRQIYADDLKKIAKAFKITSDSFFEIDKVVDLNQAKLLRIYDKLSKTSQDIVMRTAEDLRAMEKNSTTMILPIIETTEPQVTEIPYYTQSVAAGTNNYVDDSLLEKLFIPTDQIPANTDYIVRVSGDSMEPTLHSGDRLYVQRTADLHKGDIGIFNYQGNQLVKEVGVGELISHNKEYPPIKIVGDLYVQGKVLGIV